MKGRSSEGEVGSRREAAGCDSLWRLAARGASLVAARPALVALAFAAHLAALGGTGLLAAALLPSLRDRDPAPGLFEWLSLGRERPRLTLRLGVTTGAVVLAHGVLAGALLAGALLERLRGGGLLGGAKRHFPALAAIRLAGLLGLSALIGAASFTARTLHELGSGFDHDAALVMLILPALPLFLIPLATLGAAHTLAQCLVVTRRAPPLLAVRQSLALVQRRPGLCAALWLSGWAGWLALLPLQVAAGSVIVDQLAALARAALHVWCYAAFWGLVEERPRRELGEAPPAAPHRFEAQPR